MLADRVGIIDHGHIVAEGTPQALKAEIGLPSVHAIPANESRSRAARRRARSVRRGARHGSSAKSPSGCTRGSRDSRPSSARSTTRASLSPAWRSRRPRSTTSSSPRPAGRWRAPREAEAEAAEPVAVTDVWPQIGALAWRSVVRTSRQPAAVVFPLIFPMMLLLVNSGGLQGLDEAARLPDRLLPRVRARRPVHPGRALLDHERGHRPREGHPDGLPEPALADVDARRRR